MCNNTDVFDSVILGDTKALHISQDRLSLWKR